MVPNFAVSFASFRDVASWRLGCLPLRVCLASFCSSRRAAPLQRLRVQDTFKKDAVEVHGKDGRQPIKLVYRSEHAAATMLGYIQHGIPTVS